MKTERVYKFPHFNHHKKKVHGSCFGKSRRQMDEQQSQSKKKQKRARKLVFSSTLKYSVCI